MTLADDCARDGGGAPAGQQVLGSWKEIAQYLQRDVRTVMRWERTRGMPIHRLPGTPRAPVHAFKSELDTWRNAQPDAETSGAPGADVGRRRRPLALIPAVLSVVLVVAGALGLAMWKARPAAPAIRSIAVLPFQDLGGDAGQAFLADGISEILTSELVRAGGIRVSPYSTTVRYAGTKAPAHQIARELNVDAFVQGSVLHSGNRVRIDARLVRGDSEEHLWANRYERTGEDAVGLVVDVATAITREVRLAIGGGERSVRPEVLDLYLRGQFAYRSLTRDGLDSALAHYRRAVALDAEFTLGWAAIGATRTVQAFMGFLPPGDALPEGRDALERALRLDPGQGEAYGNLGYIALYFDRDFEKARRTLELARSLSPDSMMIRHEHADYLLVRGRVDDSLAEVQAGRSNDPTAWPGHGVVLYHALLARRFDIVLADGLKVLEAMPTRNTRTVHSWIARALWMTGRELEALERMRSVYEVDDAAWVRVERATRQLGARAGMAELARWMAAREPKNLQAGAFETATLFAAAGDTASALAWLERSDARREPFLLHAGADPFLDPISSDSRFLSFLKRLDITPAPR